MADGKGCKCGASGESECACKNVDWTPQEVYDLRTENAVLRGVNQVLRSLVHDKFKTNEWNCAGIPKWEGFKQEDWKTGDTKAFLGLTDAEVDTLDKWMEKGKDKAE